MSYAQIQNNRQYTGIYLFYVTEATATAPPAGTVLTQEPAAGAAITEGDNPTIRLVISKGPEMVEMPQHHRLYPGGGHPGAGEPGPCAQLLHWW